MELMFEYGLGVSTVNSYVVKRVDSDFFSEDGGSVTIPDPIVEA